MKALFFLAAALTAASPVTGQSQLGPVAAGERRQLLADEVANVTASDALMRNQLDRTFSEALPAQFEQSPGLGELETRYPGLIAGLVEEIKPIMTDYILRSVPDYRREASSIYAASFDEAELEHLLSFYKSPTGQKLLWSMNREADFRGMAAEVALNPDGKLTSQALRAATDTSIKAAVAELSPAEIVEVEAFGLSPLAPKLIAVRSKLQLLMVDLANRPDPALVEEIDAISSAFIERFIADQPSRAGNH